MDRPRESAVSEERCDRGLFVSDVGGGAAGLFTQRVSAGLVERRDKGFRGDPHGNR